MSNTPVYRKEFIFDIDTKIGDSLYGDYRKTYPIIGSFLNKNGFMHIEGSAYTFWLPNWLPNDMRTYGKPLLS